MNDFNFVIAVRAIGREDFITISEKDFVDIRTANKFILFGLDIEEKLDLLVENYADIEKEILDMAVQNSIHPGAIYDLIKGSRHRVNRRFVNFLTAVQLYKDQIRYSLTKVYEKDSEIIEKFDKKSNYEYDNSLGYRVVEALRNHVQHASLPITSISFPARRVEPTLRDITSPKQRLISFSVSPYVGLDKLKENNKFKKTILKELEKIADDKNNIRLMPIVRQHVESIGHLHNLLRGLCKESIEDAQKLIEENICLAECGLNSPEAGLAAIKRDNVGLHEDFENISRVNIERWQELQKKNRHLDQISPRFVTSECLPYDS
jgi:hypothetical protein